MKLQASWVYDLSDANVVNLENGSVNDGIVLRRVFHTQPPAIIRYFDPFIGTGLGSQQMLETFGWVKVSYDCWWLCMEYSSKYDTIIY
jgi:hypothetical protein